MLGVAEWQVQDGARGWSCLMRRGRWLDTISWIHGLLPLENTFCKMTVVMSTLSECQTHHKSSFPVFTLDKIPLSALIDGVKKYSPPRGITKGDTAFILTALFASCGNKPVISTCSLLLSWPRTASKPTPGLTKFRSLAHWPWMKAKPLLMVLW